MNVSKDKNNNLVISGVTIELAELLQTAILAITEKHKENRPSHEKLLRRLAMQIDSALFTSRLQVDQPTTILDEITQQANARGLDMRQN